MHTKIIVKKKKKKTRCLTSLLAICLITFNNFA